jgi:uncharacterized protein YgbK (DUF1537 family)
MTFVSEVDARYLDERLIVRETRARVASVPGGIVVAGSVSPTEGQPVAELVAPAPDSANISVRAVRNAVGRVCSSARANRTTHRALT